MGSRARYLFFKSKETGILPVTDRRMTRFMITLDQSIDLVWKTILICVVARFLSKIPSMSILILLK